MELTPLNSDVPGPKRRRRRRSRSQRQRQQRREYSTAKRMKRLAKQKRYGVDERKRVPTDAPRCRECEGRGRVLVPDLSEVTMDHLAALAGLDRTYLSRMFSCKPEQRRRNPSLRTLRALQEAVVVATGTRLSLDALAEAIDPVAVES